jgi:hypothetical protein
MKKVQVTIKLLMEVPDNWKVVKTPHGVPVFDMGDGNFLDMSFSTMITSETGEDATWTDVSDDEYMDSIMEKVIECDTKIKEI